MLLEISAYKNNNKKKVFAFIGLNTSHTQRRFLTADSEVDHFSDLQIFIFYVSDSEKQSL